MRRCTGTAMIRSDDYVGADDSVELRFRLQRSHARRCTTIFAMLRTV